MVLLEILNYEKSAKATIFSNQGMDVRKKVTPILEIGIHFLVIKSSYFSILAFITQIIAMNKRAISTWEK